MIEEAPTLVLQVLVLQNAPEGCLDVIITSRMEPEASQTSQYKPQCINRRCCLPIYTYMRNGQN